eukprot:scaffold89_cov318-Pavlova_lutheri.AAC.10
MSHTTERIHGGRHEGERRLNGTSILLAVNVRVFLLLLASLAHSERAHGRERPGCNMTLLLDRRCVLPMLFGKVDGAKAMCSVRMLQDLGLAGGHPRFQSFLHRPVALDLLVELLHCLLVCGGLILHLPDRRFFALEVEHASVLRDALDGFLEPPQFVGEEGHFGSFRFVRGRLFAHVFLERERLLLSLGDGFFPGFDFLVDSPHVAGDSHEFRVRLSSHFQVVGLGLVFLELPTLSCEGRGNFEEGVLPFSPLPVFELFGLSFQPRPFVPDHLRQDRFFGHADFGSTRRFQLRFCVLLHLLRTLPGPFQRLDPFLERLLLLRELLFGLVQRPLELVHPRHELHRHRAALVLRSFTC